jgi:EmrB/QacA subfamily drug resistance transporter
MPLFRAPAVDRRWIFFGLAALSILMSSIDGTIVAVALPTLIDDLHANLVWAGWTLTAYALTQTVMMPVAGKLAEQFGQMRVFLACVFLFTLGSLLCGLAPNIYLLVACRILQALGGGGFMPAATGLIVTAFPESRGRMIGLFASIYPTGAIIGPNLGGFIIQNYGWRQIFLVNVPLGILVIALLARQARQVPATTRATVRRQIDILGAVLFATTIVGLLSALTIIGDDPTLVSSPIFWLMLGGSAALLGAFIWQERRVSDPILDLSLVTRHPFGIVNVYSVLTGACFMGFFSFIPYYATLNFGMGPLESGAILTPRSLVMIVTSTSISFLLHRLGYRIPMLVGMGCVTAVLLLLGHGLTSVQIGSFVIGPVVPLLLIMSLSGLGMGMLSPASNNAGLDLMPKRAGVISGIRGLFNSTGGVLGTAIIVLWLELSPDKAAGLRSVFTALGFLMLATMPLVFLIPDSARDRRRAAAVLARESEAQAIEAEMSRIEAEQATTMPAPALPLEPMSPALPAAETTVSEAAVGERKR